MPRPARTWQSRRGWRVYDAPISLGRQPDRHSPPKPGGRAGAIIEAQQSGRKILARRSAAGTARGVEVVGASVEVQFSDGT